MKIILLGTGTTLPQVNRNTSGLLIEIDGDCLLFDCGSGILRQIEEAHVDFTQIHNIFISHMHADHVSDLPILLKANLMRKNPNILNIFGPSTLKKQMNAWFTEIYPYLDKILDKIRIEEIIAGASIETRAWKIQFIPVHHGIEAYGFKLISKGKVIVYSGDTAPCEELIQAANNADVLIHECSYPSDLGPRKDHTTPHELGKIAQQAKIKRLVLTHFYPEIQGREREILEDIKKYYNGISELGKDLLTIELV